MSNQTKINKVFYEKKYIPTSYLKYGGVHVWRIYYTENWFGIVRKYKQKIGFFPSASINSLDSAYVASDALIKHYKKSTGNSLVRFVD